jgi:hypothetical protein
MDWCHNLCGGVYMYILQCLVLSMSPRKHSFRWQLKCILHYIISSFFSCVSVDEYWRIYRCGGNFDE